MRSIWLVGRDVYWYRCSCVIHGNLRMVVRKSSKSIPTCWTKHGSLCRFWRSQRRRASSMAFCNHGDPAYSHPFLRGPRDRLYSSFSDRPFYPLRLGVGSSRRCFSGRVYGGIGGGEMGRLSESAPDGGVHFCNYHASRG